MPTKKRRWDAAPRGRRQFPGSEFLLYSIGVLFFIFFVLSSSTLLLHHQWSLSRMRQANGGGHQEGFFSWSYQSSNRAVKSLFTNASRKTKLITPIRPFHRWNHSAGILVEPLWQYMRELHQAESASDNNAVTSQHNGSNQSQYYEGRERIYNRLLGPIPGWIEAGTFTLLLAVKVYRRRSRFTVQGRFETLGPFLQEALWDLRGMEHQGDSRHHISESASNEIRTAKSANASYSFSYLRQVLQDGQGGMPIIFLADDFTGCLEGNYEYTSPTVKSKLETNASSNAVIIPSEKVSIPFLTLSAAPECGYAFPIPSYSVLQLAKQTSGEWDDEFRAMDQRYPWNTKKHLAVWRGALSGTAKWNGSATDLPRFHLMILSEKHPNVIDAALACSPRKCFVKPLWKPLLRWGEHIPMDDFQNFWAIIDIDGNSWSERFTKLLCRNSVVIKVQPEQVDYFWPTLQAGVHYIAANLTTLVETVEYVLAPEHDEEMRRVVANARRWCRHRMIVKRIQWDFLSILNGYAEQLLRGNPYWHRNIQRSDFKKMGFRHPIHWRTKNHAEALKRKRKSHRQP